jgi:hypothetical protein
MRLNIYAMAKKMYVPPLALMAAGCSGADLEARTQRVDVVGVCQIRLLLS